MNRFLKWTILAGGSLVAALVLAVVLLPSMIEMERYRPVLEAEASRALGRSVRLEGEMALSVFPWIGARVGRLSVDNPEGFSEPRLLSVEAAEIRVAVLPLFRRVVAVRRFVLREPRIALERTPEGRANWEGIGAQASGRPSDRPSDADVPPDSPSDPAPESTPAGGGRAVADFVADELTVSDGRLLWIDGVAGERRVISGLNLRVENLSFDRPVKMDLSAELDGHPVRLTGEVGPMGTPPGTGTIPLSLTISGPGGIEAGISGSATDPMGALSADLSLSLSPFSPRATIDALGLPVALRTADPGAFGTLGLRARFRGGPEAFVLSDGALTLDGSRVAFSAEFRGSNPPDFAAKIEIDALDTTRYLPPPAENGSAAPEKPGKPERTGDAPSGFDPSLLENAILDLDFRAGRLILPGDVSISDAGFRISGEKGRFDLDISARRDGRPIALSGRIGPFARDRIGLDLRLNALDLMGAKIAGAVVRPDDDPVLEAEIAVEPFDPRKLAEALGIAFPVKTADPDALRRVGFRGKVRAGANSARVRDAVWVLDETSVRGRLDAAAFSPPDIGFDLALDRIDADRYLPPEAGNGASAASGEGRGEVRDAPMDFERLRRIRLNGAFRADALRVRRLEMANIRLKIFGEQGIFRLDPLRVNLYRGAMSLAGTMDISGPEPVFRAEGTVENVATGPLLAAAADSDAVRGILNASAKLAARGDGPDAVARTLDGTADLHLSDGRIRGMDLVGMARNLEAAYRRVRGEEETEAGTDFSELKAALTIEKGRIALTEGRLASPVLEAVAEGAANLPDRTLDLRVIPTFVRPTGGRPVVAVPVVVGGTFDRPTYRPDLANLIRIDPRRAAEAIARDPKQGVRDLIDEQKDRIRSILLPGREVPEAEGDDAESSSDPEAEDSERREDATPEARKPSVEDAFRDLLRTLPKGK